ncbi:MAG: 4Fe-4S dicluster domain-containing protein [Oscillospiraceae bacterium]
MKEFVRKFDTQVQYLEYKVLREVARHAWNDTLLGSYKDIANSIVKGSKPTMRCCVHKERAIVAERVDLAEGGNKKNKNVIEVIEIACDECPESGYEVSDSCRGCIAHHCEDACKLNAISFDENQKAHIKKDKCVNCGACAKVCPYSAIHNHTRPCEKACKVKAIGMNEDKSAKIDDEKCISCGACVYHCPFGAIMDKSFMVNVINMIKESENNTKYKVYAVIAPSIASQFTYDSNLELGQVISAIKKLGFHSVVEAALGADMVASAEAQELVEKKFLTSSCCPAFVDYIEKEFPQLTGNISHNLSPMATISKYIKKTDPDAKVVFIGPCTAKKMEIQKERVKPYVDSALTFAELQAMIDSRDINMADLPVGVLDNASYFGRIFARCGGLADAVAQGLKEYGHDDFDLVAESCDGIEQCRIALLKASKGVLKANFIEGMACVGGCIGGAGCLTHGPRNKAEVDKYGKEAHEKTIKGAIENLT